jgi:transcriptional regulator with XRE-family HTH domain
LENGNSKQSEENLVKKTCRELGITQKELAEKIGVTPQALSRWSRGSTIPKNIEVLLGTMMELSKFKKAIPQLKDIRTTLDNLISN